MHVHIGQQGRERTAPRRAPPMSTAARPSYTTRDVPLLDQDVEPETEQMQHRTVADPPRDRFQQVCLRNGVEGTHDTLFIPKTFPTSSPSSVTPIRSKAGASRS